MQLKYETLNFFKLTFLTYIVLVVEVERDE